MSKVPFEKSQRERATNLGVDTHPFFSSFEHLHNRASERASDSRRHHGARNYSHHRDGHISFPLPSSVFLSFSRRRTHARAFVISQIAAAAEKSRVR